MLKRITSGLMILAGVIALQSSPLLAQDTAQQGSTAQQGPAAQQAGTAQDIQMLREDLRSQKKQIVAANMQLTDAEATKFWPVYDQYSSEGIKLGDARLALIKEYAQTYNTMTDAQAIDLIKRWESVDEQGMKLRQQYIPKFEKVLPGKKAALFFQMDRRLALLMDLQLASMIPMVQP